MTPAEEGASPRTGSAMAVPDVALPLQVGDPEFGLLRDVVFQEAGIHLTEAKRALLSGRLAPRLRRLGLHSFLEYWRRVDSDPDEKRHLVEAICTHETQFFREATQLRQLQEWVIPRWRDQAAAGLRPPRIRAWCAGCATGEEPYSLAMLLDDGLRGGVSGASPDWSIEILASDISTRALARAEDGVYTLERVQAVPEALRRRYFLRGVGGREGSVKVAPELRALVRFERNNLSDVALTVNGPFDLIMCRNVLIYFRPADRIVIVERLVRSLTSEGLFLVGHAESLRSGPSNLRSLGSMIYCSVDSEWATLPRASRSR